MLGLGTIQHVADKTMNIGGYTIPEGSVVSGVTRGLMYEPTVKISLFRIKKSQRMFIGIFRLTNNRLKSLSGSTPIKYYQNTTPVTFNLKFGIFKSS